MAMSDDDLNSLLSQWSGSMEGSTGEEMAGLGGAEAPRYKKTVMCKYYAWGKCGKGENCTFAHSEDELGTFQDANVEGGGKGSCKWCILGECWKHQGAKGKGSLDNGKGGEVGKSSDDDFNSLLSQWSGSMEGDLGFGSTSDAMAGLGGAEAPRYKKTVMCKFFASGTCTKGENCTFAHSEDELGSFQDASVAGGGKGSCKWCMLGECWEHQGAKGKGSLDNGKAGEKGKSKGQAVQLRPDCRWCVGVPCWKHAKERTRSEPYVIGKGSSKKGGESIESNDLGFGSIGEAMAGLGGAEAPRYKKTVMCKFFASGTCTKGENCTFAHSEDELGTFQGANVEGGGKGGCKWCMLGECWNH